MLRAGDLSNSVNPSTDDQASAREELAGLCPSDDRPTKALRTDFIRSQDPKTLLRKREPRRHTSHQKCLAKG
ncbi:hypothetical protein GUJ93_ZPchr0009g2018 [Zizania palustris]|uniref:Uncharacterized protein n=1 Tax=Zizania palustris TaxID=103762 RepID=A0A8J5S663_ZIZPA|nr:hypothetical protein GUJ93_ZPchr0009g2018 [Zizania palustris]